MKAKYYYFDLEPHNNGEVIDNIQDGVWVYGMTYMRIYKDLLVCYAKECLNIPKGYIYEVEPLATIYDSEDNDQELTSALRIIKEAEGISWM